MVIARLWTGREAAALRHAHRMSIRAYAARLGLTVSTVANWDSRAERARLRTETQQLLDLDLARAPDDVRERFTALLASKADGFQGPLLVAGRAPANGAPTPDTIVGLLPSVDALRPQPASTGRRIGRSTVDNLAARAHRLRLADDVLAGGDLIGPAFRELRSGLRLCQECTYTEDTGRALLAQVGELAQIAGWIASDAGRPDLAERAYGVGISAAREAGDRPLAANLIGSLAYQCTNLGRRRDGIELARVALDEAGRDAVPKAQALFLDRLAWAYAKCGEEQPAIRALGEAHEALSAHGTVDDPPWAYWVSREELEVMDARVFTELHRPREAVTLLSDVLVRYDATHARETALYLSWLAVALADADEPVAAAGVAARMLELATDMASDRTAERARVVLDRLVAFKDVPEVRVVLADHPAM